MIPSPMNIIPDVENIQLQQNRNEDPSADKQQKIKPPKSAYNLWYLHRKEELKRNRPKWHMSEINKQIFYEWRLLPADVKQPFIDESKRLMEQHMRDHPDYVSTRQRKRKPKPSNRSTKSAVVSYSLSPHLTPALYAEAQMSNPPVSASEEENKSNDSEGSIPNYLKPSTSYIAPLYFSNLHCAGSQTFNSMAAHKEQIKEVETYDCKFTYFAPNARKQDLNPEDSVHIDSSTLSADEHTRPEPQRHKEESPLDLCDITMISSTMNNMPNVKNMQWQQNKKEDSSADNQQYFQRPMNAYMLWCRNRRQELISSLPNLLPDEITKLMADEWKQLPAEGKQNFKDRAKRLKEQHRREHPHMYPPPRNPKPPGKSKEPEVVPSIYAAAFGAGFLAPNTPVFALDGENKSNDPKVSIPIYHKPPSPYIASLHVSNSHSAGRQAFTSTAEHNAQSKTIVPCEYKFTNSSQNASTQELNTGDSVHSNTSSSYLAQHTWPETQHQNEEYPLDLSIRKDR